MVAAKAYLLADWRFSSSSTASGWY